MNRIGQLRIAGKLERVSPQQLRLRDGVLEQLAAYSMATIALGDSHLRHFEYARLYKDQCAAANPLLARYRHHNLPAGPENVARRVSKLDAILFLKAEVPCDPRFVQLAKGFGIG